MDPLTETRGFTRVWLRGDSNAFELVREAYELIDLAICSDLIWVTVLDLFGGKLTMRVSEIQAYLEITPEAIRRSNTRPASEDEGTSGA